MHLYLLLGVPLGSGSLLLNSPSLLDAERSHGPNLWPLKYNSWPQRGPTKPNQSQRTSTADHKKQHQQRAILTLNSDCIRGWETPSGDTLSVQSWALYGFTIQWRSSLPSWRGTLSRRISALLTRDSVQTCDKPFDAPDVWLISRHVCSLVGKEEWGLQFVGKHCHSRGHFTRFVINIAGKELPHFWFTSCRNFGIIVF